jgi:glycosyltransferase involved in cell wall biosynthesis
MRVGIVAEQLLAPVPGGTGRYSRELSFALAAGAASGDSVHSWTGWRRDVEPARVPGVDGPRRLPAGPRLLAWAWQRGLPPRVTDCEVVHAPTPLAPRTSGPLVVTVHDAVPWTHPQTLTPHGARWHRAIIARAIADGAVIATPTRAVAADLVAVLPQLDAGRVHVLGGGVSPSLLAPTALAPDVAGSYLITVATLEPRKGLQVAIEALASLGADAPRLVVAGQAGWGGLDPRALAASAGLDPDRLMVLGRVPDEQLQVLIRGARALLMPSVAEGFGLPVAEAMALGTPVICSDIASLAEVAGGAALLVPVGSVGGFAAAIRAVAEDTVAAELAERGLAQAPRHSWAAVADRAWALYRSLLG